MKHCSRNLTITFHSVLDRRSSNPERGYFGNDVPVPGDYDGDGKTDIAVFRPRDGNFSASNPERGYFRNDFGNEVIWASNPERGYFRNDFGQVNPERGYFRNDFGNEVI